MPDSFDPYHAWLGIPKEEQPPNHYRLLGITLLEGSLTTIEHAADQRMAHLRTFQSGKHTKFSQKLLNEVAAARVCLLNPQKKAAYDEQLRQTVKAKPHPKPTDYEETVQFDAEKGLPGGQPATARRLGEYELIEKLGEGGMGTVYKALHTKLGRKVALKVLPKGRIGNEQAVARFEAEARASFELDHPNIVRATDAGSIRGTWFLVMELVEGLDLKEVVRRAGPLPIADACEIVRQAALGLQCAHQNKLVHRDIKPSNLMLTAAGQVKLLDLGLARFQTGHPAGDEMTATGAALGTLDYMAPEQASDTHSVDIRADVYSLGCTLFKLLTGRAPFDDPRFGSAYEKMNAHVKRPPPKIARLRNDIPKELAAVVNRMLAKDPAQRHATPAEVADAVGPFAGGHDLLNLLARAQHKPPMTRPSQSLEGTDGSRSSGLTRFFQAMGARRQPAAEAAPVARSKLPLILGASGAGLALLVAVVVGGLMMAGRGSSVPVKETTAIAFDWPADQRQGVVLGIDGRPADVPESGPFVVECLPGKHRIRALRRGFEPYEEQIEVAAGKRLSVKPAWVPRSHLVLDWPESQRDDAELSIDGKTPDLSASENETDAQSVKIVLAAGSYAVRIARRGFEPFEQTVTIAKGEDSRVTPVWSPSSGPPEMHIAGPEPAPGEKLPVPADDVQQPVVERIDAFYKVAEASTPAEKAALAERMLEAAASKEDPIERFVILDRAVKLSTDAGDEALLREAVDALAARFEVDAVELIETAQARIAQIWQQQSEARATEAAAAGLAEAERLRRQRWTEATATAKEKIAAWDFRGAMESLAQVKFDDDELAGRLARRRDEVRRMGVLKERMIAKINASASKLKKSDLMLKGVNGQISGADEQGITAKLISGKSESLAWPELNAKARQRVLQLVVDRSSGDDWLSAGILAFACRDVEFAEKLFGQASRAGTDIGPYLASMAEAIFGEANEFIAKEEFSEAIAALALLETKYGKTPWYASHKDMVDAARAATEFRIYEAEAEELYAKAAKLYGEKELFATKDLIDKLKGDYATSKAASDTTRQPSLEEMEKAVVDLGPRLVVRLDGKGDFKSIQAAIDAAEPGSLIEIHDNGPYNEMLVIPKEKEGLTLRGKKGCWAVITSLGPVRDFATLLSDRASGTTLERLVLAHCTPVGEYPISLRAGNDSHVRSTIVFGLGCTRAISCGKASFETCLFLSPMHCEGSGAYMGCLFLGGKNNLGNRRQFQMNHCTVLGDVHLTHTPSVVRNSIIGRLTLEQPGHRVENCAIVESPVPESARNCLAGNPQLRNPGSLDFRLQPTSPCRGKASDGGDLGCRYTPEMLEMCKIALELRARGIIKF